MNFKDAVLKSLATSDFFVDRYLSDLTPEELLHRTSPDANHVAWQFGHLIAAERHLVEAAVPGSMPELPAGFVEQHGKENGSSDKQVGFLSKDEYFALKNKMRAGTLAALEKLPDADLDNPVSGRVPPFVKQVGDCFLTVGGHWGMHSGQWVALRRKLGRPRQF